jgi:protein-L-isoaspartate(D-aspartate) O-methyltransferase
MVSRLPQARWLFGALVCSCTLACCSSRGPQPPVGREPAHAARTTDPSRFDEQRERMVTGQLLGRDIDDRAVLEAMRRVPRHEFVLESYREQAYDDTPLPIEAQQTISQPYIVALMTQLAAVEPGDRVLEVGTGSGYQAAVLAAMGAEVLTIEIVEQLAASAKQRLARLGYRAKVRYGDGYAGWPERAPFDAILITAAPPAIPEPLKAQLKVGGRLIVPVGQDAQDLVVLTRTAQGFEQRSVLPVRFVPMTGRAQQGY